MNLLKVALFLCFLGMVTPIGLLKLKLPLLLLKKKAGFFKKPHLIAPPPPPLPILKFHKYQGIDIKPVLPLQAPALSPGFLKTGGTFLSGLGAGSLISGLGGKLANLGSSFGLGGNSESMSLPDTSVHIEEPSVNSPEYPSVPIPMAPQVPSYNSYASYYPPAQAYGPPMLPYSSASYSSSASSYNPPAPVYGPPVQVYPPIGTYPASGEPQINLNSGVMSFTDGAMSSAVSNSGVSTDSSTEDPSAALAALDSLAPLAGFLPDENGNGGGSGGALAVLSSLLPSGVNLGSLANLAKGAHNLLPKGPKHLPGFLAKKFAPAAYEFKIGKPYITVRHPYSSLGEDRQQVALGETGMDTAGIFDQIPLENFEFMEVQQPEIPPQLSMVQYPSYKETNDFINKASPTYNQDLSNLHQSLGTSQRKSAQDRQGEEEITVSFLDQHSTANSQQANDEAKSLQGGFEPSSEAALNGQGYSKVYLQNTESRR